ncbi:polysaccharide biosynthesis tyrosine autokinase [Steroidobacter cummioxidans]|uniref:polysaccharide biosynthesis tyrosine autokinase n=1 Tax=Steroidobacter cummioxidans TaxID=1803913 RepID=UPI000E3234FB|nr:polysaccharide biosynthesis tyrosine autokinase [Steroidobacter cummioxidans]
MDAAVEPRSRLPRVTRPRIRIGEILLNMGALSEADLQKVLAAHLDRGEPFGKVAVAMKLITEGELRSALAQQFSYPIARIGESALSPLLAAAYEPFGQYAEGLRTLRSQLLMRWMGEHDCTLAVCSARSGEGCSVLAANLAIVFAQLGERTLLIDANLRNPVQHHLFGLGECDGLTDLIKGASRTEKALRKVAQFESLNVLTAGTPPPNPQELLSRLPFAQLLDEMAGRYDVIILDTPPLLEFADGQIIATRARGCLLGTRRDSTRLIDIARMKAQLDPNLTHVLGTVISG